jgi:hypothetical protein
MIPRLHESTARALCRLVFVAFGLVPLGICLVWSVQVFLPKYQRQQASRWEQLLHTQFGGHLTIAAVEALAPQRFALHEIRLLHPETKLELGRVRRADVERVEGKWKVTLTAPELEGAQLATTWKEFHDWFLCRPRQAGHAAWIGMDELTIHSSAGPSRFTELSLELLPGAEATVLSIQFRHTPVDSTGTEPSSETSPKLSQFIVKRHHRPEQLRTELQLRTGSSQLACAHFAALHPILGRLGNKAHFAGTIDWNLQREKWQLRVTQGRFTGVDMAQLTADTEASISGEADVLLEQFSLGQVGIEAVRGRGEILAGKMTQGFFHSFGKHLGVALRDTNQVSAYGFDRCEFALDLREPNLHWYLAMNDALGPLAARGAELWQQPVPLVNVVAAIQSCTEVAPVAGSQRSELPVTWLAKQALLWLPLGDEQSQLAEAHLRLSSNQNRE